MSLLGVESKEYLSTTHKYWRLSHPDFQVDQFKIYPCVITPWTKIKEWYDNCIYKPYSWEELTDLLLKFKSHVFPWVRLNRIVRDIPEVYVYVVEKSNLNQLTLLICF